MLFRAIIWVVAIWLAMSAFRSIMEGTANLNSRRRTARPAVPGQRKRALATLGLNEGASKAEIREAYRQLAKKYHPDRVAHLGPELIELTSEKFKEISEAHDVLTGKGRRKGAFR